MRRSVAMKAFGSVAAACSGGPPPVADERCGCRRGKSGVVMAVLRAGQTVAATQRWRAETWLENREIKHKNGRGKAAPPPPPPPRHSRQTECQPAPRGVTPAGKRKQRS